MEAQPARQKRQSGYGPDGKQMPSPGKTRVNPPAPGSDESKPKVNGQNDSP
jgi:hypothetical protein